MPLKRTLLAIITAGLSSLLIFGITGCEAVNSSDTALPYLLIQGPVVESWTEYYNGPASQTDIPWSIAIDDLGNVYMAGLSYTDTNNVDYCTIKYDCSGNLLWIKYYDGPAHGEDRAWAMTLDKLGNVYITGESQGNDTDYDYATVKYNSEGAEIWTARYNGPSSGSDEARLLTVDESGNTYVTGKSQGNNTDYDYAAVKYDSNGTELWSARYNGPASGDDETSSIAIDKTGNIYVTGKSQGNGSEYDYATAKYDPDGAEVWVSRYNGPGSTNDVGFDVAVDESGNIYVTGVSGASITHENEDVNYDYATVKYNPDGQEMWTARYDGPDSGTDKPSTVAVDPYGNVYVSGSSADSRVIPFNYDYATVKYNSDGEEIWAARYNSTESTIDSVIDMTIDPTGNIYVTGTSLYLDEKGSIHNCATIKYNSNGQKIWIAQHDTPGIQADYVNAIAIDASNNVYITGWIIQENTGADFFTVKYSQLEQ